MYRYVTQQLPMQREERRLLSVNAPSVMLPSCSVNFTKDGKMILYDGRRARLAEVDISEPTNQQRIGQECASIIRLIKASKMGYTITGTDPDGTPIVHLWALSVNEFRGLDDGDSFEHWRARLMLWRNVNATLIEEGRMPFNGLKQERLEPHTKVLR